MIKGTCYNDLVLVLTQMKRMELVLMRKYGEAAYFASKQPNWVQLAKKRSRIKVPTQGNNQCGFYMLQYAYHFDGDKMVYERQENKSKYREIVADDVI